MRKHSTNQKITSLLLAIFAILVTACGSQGVPFPVLPMQAGGSTGQPATPVPAVNSGQTGAVPFSDPSKMTAIIQCADARRDACGLLVTLFASDKDINVDLRLHSDSGLHFLPNLDVLPERGGDDSVIARINLLAGESRQILFPYQPSDLDLPGAFQVSVLAADAVTHDLYAFSRVNVYVVLNEIGEFHLLPSDNAYNDHYRNLFNDGLLKIGYRIDLESGERPFRGHIWVRVDGREDGYQPTVQLVSSGAVTFLNDGIWKPVVTNGGMTATRKFPPINEGGARVAKFPFELDRNGRLLDGDYAFQVTLSYGNPVVTKTEKMPIVVQLFSDPQYPSERWLGRHPVTTAATTPTPDAAAAAIDLDNIVLTRIGMGGQLQGLDPATAAAHCQRLETVRFDDDLPKPNWTREIGNYSGTLCQTYLDFVAGSVPLSWGAFRQRMLLENSQYLTSETDLLQAHQVYVLPELDQ